MNVKAAKDKLEEIFINAHHNGPTWAELRQILEAMQSPAQEPQEISLAKSKERIEKDLDKFMEAQDECKHDWKYEISSKQYICPKCDEIKEEQPAQSLKNLSIPLSEYKKDVEEMFEAGKKAEREELQKQYEEWRRETYQAWYIEHGRSRFEDGKKAERAEMKERFDKVFDDRFLHKAVIYRELFGNE